MTGTFGRGKMKRMQSTPLFVPRSDRNDNCIGAVNLSPIFSADSSSIAVMPQQHSGLSALSTLYGDKMCNFTTKNAEVNDFSHWLGPKIACAATEMSKNQLDGTYIVKTPEKPMDIIDPSNKENLESDTATLTRSNAAGLSSVFSDILNKQNGELPMLPKSPDKISITVNQQSSVWLNASRDYAKEPINESDDKDMEELHTELDKILDQLQKLVT